MYKVARDIPLALEDLELLIRPFLAPAVAGCIRSGKMPLMCLRTTKKVVEYMIIMANWAMKSQR